MVGFVNFPSGEFTIVAVVNLLDGKRVNRSPMCSGYIEYIHRTENW